MDQTAIIVLQIATAIAGLLVAYVTIRVTGPLLGAMELREDGELRFLLFRIIPVYRVHIERITRIETISFVKAMLLGFTRPTMGWLDRPWGRLVWMITDSGLNIIASPPNPELLIERVRRAKREKLAGQAST